MVGQEAQMEESRMMKVNEVAARLRVDPETVRNWLRSGRLRGVRMGGRRAGWRIPVAEVERLERGG